MDIFNVLEEEHEELKKQANDLAETTDRAIKTRQKGFAKFYLNIKAHHETEEELLVPVLKDKKDTWDDGMEINEEHHVLELVLQELQKLAVDDENWIIKFKVMQEIMEHHLDEEEDEICENARKNVDKETLKNIGEKFHDVKNKYKDKYKGELE